MPLDNQSGFLHIDNWQEFKDKLICDFCSLEMFQGEALKQFSQIDQPLQTLKELTDILVPAINSLKSYIKCVATFMDPTILNNITLSSTLNELIISCIPI